MGIRGQIKIKDNDDTQTYKYIDEKLYNFEENNFFLKK